MNNKTCALRGNLHSVGFRLLSLYAFIQVGSTISEKQCLRCYMRLYSLCTKYGGAFDNIACKLFHIRHMMIQMTLTLNQISDYPILFMHSPFHTNINIITVDIVRMILFMVWLMLCYNRI